MRRALKKFKPSNIPGLALHLDATKGITSVGDHVSAWADQSGNLRHASQGTDDYRPHLVTSSLNGKPVIRFDGSSDYLTIADWGTDGTKNHTFFIVFKNITTLTGGSNQILLSFLTNGATRWAFGSDAGTIAPEYRLGWGGTTASTTLGNFLHVNATPYIRCSVKSGDNWSSYMNGVAAGTALTSTSVLASNTVCNIGREATTVYYTNSDIAEIIVYSAALTTAQINQINLYLSRKWGIAVSLIA